MTGSVTQRARGSRAGAGPRILAGALRGRRLAVAAGVRPTESRLREALFSIWLAEVDGCRFLDLFAGSGAVGLEALSRGARHVVFVDHSPKVVTALRRNLAELDPARWSLNKARLPARLNGTPEPFDLIFADPPYSFTDHATLLDHLVGWLAPGGEIAIEHSRRVTPTASEAHWQLTDQRRYGDSCFSFFRNAAAL